MWKVITSPFSKKLLSKYISVSPPARLFLSEAFQLQEAWKSRLDSPIIKRININDFFNELDNQFQQHRCASGLDIDLYVNAVNDNYNFDEIEELVHKLRLSPEATTILPSTHHALIRLYIDYAKTEDLLRILDDRLNYGIFADDYCSLLLMDNFITSGNFKDAARVSTLCMLQEDFSNSLVKYMSLYSCYKYLETPNELTEENKQEEVQNEEDNDGDDDEEEEEVKVRVKYVRNPYFDDHFDLVDFNHLIGKTLTMIGSEIDDHLGRTIKLLGLIVHAKYVDAYHYTESLLSITKSPIMCKDGLHLINTILEQQINNEDIKDNNKQLIKDLKDLLDKSTDSQLYSENSLVSLVETILKDLVSKHENDEIKTQLQLYKDWETNRENLLKEQIKNLNKEKELAEINRQKKLLQEKELELFFFDNEHKYDLILEEKEKKRLEILERQKYWAEIRLTKIKSRVSEVVPPPPLESFFDENIPMKIVKTKF